MELKIEHGRENRLFFLVYAYKNAAKPARPSSLISVFVVCCLDSTHSAYTFYLNLEEFSVVPRIDVFWYIMALIC